ncbi:MAG: CTAG/PCC1 family protein [Nanoarchaeota archaeon]
MSKHAEWLTGSLRVPHEPTLAKVLEAEDTSLGTRSTYEVITDNEDVVIHFRAKDAVALRAVLSAITKNIVIYSQMKKVE